MKILIAEDEPAFRRLLTDVLIKWGYEVVVTKDGAEAWHILNSDDAPKLAILDWMMPGIDGPELCRRIRRRAHGVYTYVMLLTSQQGDKDLVTGMEAGADDYLTKPFRVSELRVRLRTGRRIIDLQNELIAAREFFQEKAARDSLTRLWNHEEILSILSHEMARAEREGKCLGAIMADLDHFKRINDRYGHLAGDSVLRVAAEKMLTQVRAYDSIGRYGGEEFLVILPDCGRQCAMAFAERIRQRISEKEFNTSEGMIPVTMSLGVAVSCREQRLNATDLVKAADKALYAAKGGGRNRVEVAEGG
ncbi:diguanylate cyclase [Geomonas sp. RF6]|uniref:GGDEF domain-containing response regulator n=1 Tax=Geomonas sp. RF6 TaxID=2897342 RepID=UPI001E4B676D|nr:diguanylate cyclase [Geomonas sp. RF6]UFS69965.1 diguanylate cyclase [Geomonas sp. RF6]